MNIILKHRIKLIRAMMEAKKSFPSYSLKSKLGAYISIIREDPKGWFLSLSEDDFSKVSYASKKEDILNQKTRVKTSLQRFFRRQLSVTNDEISEAALDKFCNLVALFTDETLDTKIQLISGDKISEFYSNTAIKSCMTGTCSGFKTSLYSLNPTKVQLVIFSQEVRALLWLCDDGKYVLDRCYPAGHWGIAFLRAWAKRKGYLLRNIADVVTDDYSNGISDGKQHVITLKQEGLFPYMDTFKYAAIGNGLMVASNDSTFGTAILTNTDGHCYTKEVCTYCGIVTNGGARYLSNGNSGNNILVCSSCSAKHGFRCAICQTEFQNASRYREWNMCIKCHDFSKGFSTHNKCACYSCAEKRNHYKKTLIAETNRENSKRNEQMSFKFNY